MISNLMMSVIIPTYERPVELERCLRAVAVQKYPAFDVIVVDNSARDEETAAIAHRYRAKYVHEPRRGCARHETAGLWCRALQ